MMKKRRTYLPRIVGDKVMMPADLKRLHKYMLDVEHIGIISDEMREVVDRHEPGCPCACSSPARSRQPRRDLGSPDLDQDRTRLARGRLPARFRTIQVYPKSIARKHAQALAL